MTRMKFRRKEKKYTEIWNTIIFKNKNVELTGLYTTIQACIDLEINTAGTDNEFIVSKKSLQHFCGYKDDKFKRIWNELKKAGYLKQYKIKNKNGKFEYEYELLDEPDITTHHSLIVNDDGSFTPNIPKSKLEKLKNNTDIIPEVENPPVVPEGEKSECGETGGYYNTYLNKVCMYVCTAEKNFALSNDNKKFIDSIKEKIPFDLFEEIVVSSKNKNKTFGYVEGTITNCLKDNILTLDAFLEKRKNYKPVSKKGTGSSVSKNNKAPIRKTSYHNINESFRDYTPAELKNQIKENQSKFETKKETKVKIDKNELREKAINILQEKINADETRLFKPIVKDSIETFEHEINEIYDQLLDDMNE